MALGDTATGNVARLASDLAGQVTQTMRRLEEEVQSRLEIDVSGLVAGVRARLESRLALKPINVAADIADRSGPFSWGRVRTWAWEAPRFRKIALSHVLLPTTAIEQLVNLPVQVPLPPLLEGFALVLHPAVELAAPVFGCDLMALPTRISVNADVYAAASMQAGVRDLLQPLAEQFTALGSTGGPPHLQAIASGCGLHVKVSPRVLEEAFAALGTALGRYFDAVDAAVPGPGGVETQVAFFRAFDAHGPRKGPLQYLMGRDWTARYSRLVFE